MKGIPEDKSETKPRDGPSLKTIKPELRHGWRLLRGRSPEIKINTFKNSNAQKITLRIWRLWGDVARDIQVKQA